MKMKKIAKFFKDLNARWRMTFGFCPECNSDAPEMDKCKICNGWFSGSSPEGFPPKKERIESWRRRYFMAKCTHGTPMEDRCSECNKFLYGMRGVSDQSPRRG